MNRWRFKTILPAFVQKTSERVLYCSSKVKEEKIREIFLSLDGKYFSQFYSVLFMMIESNSFIPSSHASSLCSCVYADWNAFGKQVKHVIRWHRKRDSRSKYSVEYFLLSEEGKCQKKMEDKNREEKVARNRKEKKHNNGS